MQKLFRRKQHEAFSTEVEKASPSDGLGGDSKLDNVGDHSISVGSGRHEAGLAGAELQAFAAR